MTAFFKNYSVPVNAPSLEVTFPQPVSEAGAVLAGFSVGFQNSQHHLRKLVVKVTCTPLLRPGETTFTKLMLSGDVHIVDRDPKHQNWGLLNAMVWGSTGDPTSGDTSLHTHSGTWQPSHGNAAFEMKYLNEPISQAIIYLTSIELETHEDDIVVSSLTVDAGNSTVRLDHFGPDSGGFNSQWVIFSPTLKVEKRKGRVADLRSGSLGYTVLATTEKHT